MPSGVAVCRCVGVRLWWGNPTGCEKSVNKITLLLMVPHAYTLHYKVEGFDVPPLI